MKYSKFIKCESADFHVPVWINPSNVDYYRPRNKIDSNQHKYCVGTIIFFSGNDQPEAIKEKPEEFELMIETWQYQNSSQLIEGFLDQIVALVRERIGM